MTAQLAHTMRELDGCPREPLLLDPVNAWTGTLILALALDLGASSRHPGATRGSTTMNTAWKAADRRRSHRRVRHWRTAAHLRWGISDEEVRRSYPGGDLIPGGRRGARWPPIDASPAGVWRWLVQMGCDRAGWYSWDRLDNAGVASADRIHPEWQEIAVGRHLSSSPSGGPGSRSRQSSQSGSWLCGRRTTSAAGPSTPPARGPTTTATPFGASCSRTLPGGRTRLDRQRLRGRPAVATPSSPERPLLGALPLGHADAPVREPQASRGVRPCGRRAGAGDCRPNRHALRGRDPCRPRCSSTPPPTATPRRSLAESPTFSVRMGSSVDMHDVHTAAKPDVRAYDGVCRRIGPRRPSPTRDRRLGERPRAGSQRAAVGVLLRLPHRGGRHRGVAPRDARIHRCLPRRHRLDPRETVSLRERSSTASTTSSRVS